MPPQDKEFADPAGIRKTWAIPNINNSKKGNGLGAGTRKYATNSYLRARRSPLQANNELKD